MMNVDPSGFGIITILTTMCVVTLATRWGGVFVMSFVPIGLRVRQFINAMSGSVLVALIAPLALDGDMGARLALGTTTIMMLTVKKPMPAIALGILVAAATRYW